MITSVDIGASLTKAAVWDSATDLVTAVIVQNQTQWSTSLALRRDRSMVTGLAAWNSRKSARDRNLYFAGLKQLINLTAATEPLHREIVFPSGDTQPLVRGVATVLDHVLAAVRDQHGEPKHVVLSHPVMWGDLEKVVLTEAAAAVGLTSLGLISEAEAAGRHAASRVSLDGTVAVFDLGASTFDFAVLRAGADGVPEVVTTEGRLIGGDDFSACVLRLARQEATGEAAHELAHVWKVDREVVGDEAERVKRDLTEADSAVFTVGDRETTLHREDFDAEIRPLVQSCLTTATEALKALGINELTSVVLTGGAARVPQFREQVAGIAHTWNAEFADLADEDVGSAVALGATRRPLPWPVEHPRARRLFTMTPRAAVLSRSDALVIGVPGGVVELSATRTVRRHAANGTQGVGSTGGPLTPVTRVVGDPSTGRVLWASPSPAFTLSTVASNGAFAKGVVFGRLAASPTRPDGEVTAMACRGDLVAWAQTGARSGALIDVRDWSWRGLELPGPVRELAFTDGSLLLARSAGSLVALGTTDLAPLAAVAVGEGSRLAVEPVHGLVCVAEDDGISGYRVDASGFERLWKRDLSNAGALTYPHGTAVPVLVVFDARDRVYRALDAVHGDQLALRDIGSVDPPDVLYPSPDPGVVYARRGHVVDRLRVDVAAS
ncbi:Hsp70 family protein [Actinosynnema sp. NPDC059797]